jgi:hypothetical protein
MVDVTTAYEEADEAVLELADRRTGAPARSARCAVTWSYSGPGSPGRC